MTGRMKSQVIFEETENRYFSLRRQYEARQITADQLTTGAWQLRFQDSQGDWWYIRGDDGAWQRWNRTSWEMAVPPHHRGPQTLADLILVISKQWIKGLLWKLPLAAGVFVVVWAIHTAILVSVDGGMVVGKNSFPAMFLALPGSLAAGTLFWAVLVGLIACVSARVAKQGIYRALELFATTPTWLEYALSHSGGTVLISLLSGSAAALCIGLLSNNRLVSFLWMLMSLGALAAQTDSLLLRTIRLAWSDAFRLINRPLIPFNPAWGGLGITGAIFGFMGAVILPFMPYAGCAGVFLLGGMVLFLALLKKENRRVGGYFCLGVLLWLAAGASPAQAGAGTPLELGKMIAFGFLPACGAFAGVLVGLSLGLFEPDSQSPPTAALPVMIPIKPVAQHVLEKLPESFPVYPAPVSSSAEQVIIKGQPALDELVKLGMAKRVITPQGGQVLPLDLAPQSPVSAIAYFLDEQGYLRPEIAIAYSPPAAMLDRGELGVEEPIEASAAEPAQEHPVPLPPVSPLEAAPSGDAKLPPSEDSGESGSLAEGKDSLP
jgi:hypothetical protein